MSHGELSWEDKKQIGIAEMAQWVKSLPCKLEDLSLVPQNPCKEQAQKLHVSAILWKAKTRGPVEAPESSSQALQQQTTRG